MNDSMMGLFAIQEGPWKLIPGQGGGGSYSQDHSPRPTPNSAKPPRDEEGLEHAFSASPSSAPNAAEPPGQLYNLDDDLGETKNLYSEKPALVARLTALLKKLRKDGRSRP